MLDPRTLEPKLPTRQLFINGQYVDPVEGGTLPVYNPTNGQKLCDAPAASATDVSKAVAAARIAFDSGPWPRMSARDRARVLRRIAEGLWKRREELALLDSLNNGKTFREALRGDVGFAAAVMAYYADAPSRLMGEVLPVSGPFHTYTLREPVGVVGAITPWNFPTGIVAWKLGPALASGCTLVLKPSELTPLTALKWGELAQEAGLPEGVLNIVPGLGEVAGEALARHPEVDKISFTGSGRTARKLLQASAASNLKKLSLELGGKSPQLIFPDADHDAAVEACFRGIFSNKGESCNAGSRVLVHRGGFADFVERLAERARSLRVGDPLDPATEMGPQISLRHLEAILGYIESGKTDGARLVAGGARDLDGAKARGNFLQPTVFTDVVPGMRIAQDEIFGPVLACLPFADEAEAVRLANGTAYGLASAIWTRDTARAQALARRLKAGVVWLNCFGQFDEAAPFGGHGESGWGRDLSHHALEQYTQVKTVWTQLPS